MNNKFTEAEFWKHIHRYYGKWEKQEDLIVAKYNKYIACECAIARWHGSYIELKTGNVIYVEFTEE